MTGAARGLGRKGGEAGYMGQSRLWRRMSWEGVRLGRSVCRSCVVAGVEGTLHASSGDIEYMWIRVLPARIYLYLRGLG